MRSFFSKPELLTYKTVLKVRKSPLAAYKVVIDMEKYPRFVPWIREAHVYPKTKNYCECSMTIGFPPITQSYLSKVSSVEPKSIVSRSNKNEVFDTLESIWEFSPDPTELISHDGKTLVTKSLITYSVKFKFASSAFQSLSQMVWDKICVETSQAFVKRINEIEDNAECFYDMTAKEFVRT